MNGQGDDDSNYTGHASRQTLLYKSWRKLVNIEIR